MADEVDMAQADCDAILAEAIYQSQRSNKPLPLTGKCHYCDDDAHGAHFCGKECADDWEYEQRIRKKQGLH